MYNLEVLPLPNNVFYDSARLLVSMSDGVWRGHVASPLSLLAALQRTGNWICYFILC